MLGAGRRAAKSASMVANAYGAIINGVLGAAWRLPKSASMVAYVHRQRRVTSRSARGQESAHRGERVRIHRQRRVRGRAARALECIYRG